MATNLNTPVDIRFNTAQLYVKWSEFVVDKLHQALDKYNIGELDGPLWASLQQEVIVNGGNAEKAVLKFLQYGRMLDMQVGRSHPLGEPGPRKKKRWFSKTYYSQVQRLSVILIREFGEVVPLQITESFNTSIQANI